MSGLGRVVLHQRARVDHQTQVSHGVVDDRRSHVARDVLAARLLVVDRQSQDVQSAVAARLPSVQDDLRNLVCHYVVYF